MIANTNTLSEENDRLRGLLTLSNRNPAQYVAASVIRSGTPGSESMFMLNKGTRDGVANDSPVIMGRGLLGRVLEAQATRSTAMDWTNPQFAASAMTEDGSIYGLVQASPGRFREADRLLLDGVPFQEELEPGVTLVTSGLGGVYPRGIPIGVVIEESGVQEGWKRSYWLRPFVSPGEATHANVLVSHDGELRDATSWLEGGSVAPGPATLPEESDSGHIGHGSQCASVRLPLRVWGVVGFLILSHFGLHLSLGLGESAPDLLVVALLIAAREVDIGRGAGLGFFLGLLDDAFSVLAFGANTFAMTLVGMGGARTRDLFVGDSLFFLTSYLVLGKWMRDFLHWVAVGEGLRESFVDTMLVQSPISAAYAGVVGVVVIAISGLGWETVR